MAKRADISAKVGPTLTPQRSIELLRQQLARFDDVLKLHSSDHEVQKWKDTTSAILEGGFGERHAMVDSFRFFSGSFSRGMSDAHLERQHKEDMARKMIVEERYTDEMYLFNGKYT